MLVVVLSAINFKVPPYWGVRPGVGGPWGPSRTLTGTAAVVAVVGLAVVVEVAAVEVEVEVTGFEVDVEVSCEE